MFRGLLTKFCIGFACCWLWACSADTQPADKPLLQVNSFSIGEEEFNRQLKFEMEVDDSFHLSAASRAEFLQSMIHTQLLVQEAKRLKLDEREHFRKTIERYWESTLIRDLLTAKGDEIRSRTVVSEEEVRAYYDENKELFTETSLENILPELRKKVEDDKVAKQLQIWTDGLKTNAKIQISDKQLNQASPGE